MARLVVLSFDNDDQAQTLVEDWWEALQSTPANEEGKVRVDLLTPIQENNVQCQIVGVYKKPTLFCNPNDGHRGRKTSGGWTKGKKWGWWVCGTCHKPSLLWGNNINAVLGSARNLLPEITEPEKAQPYIEKPIAAEDAQAILDREAPRD